MIHRTRAPEPRLDLQNATTPQETLQILLKFEDSLPIAPEHVQGILRHLIEHYFKEENGSVKSKIASLLGELSKAPAVNVGVLVDDIQSMMRNEGIAILFMRMFSEL